MIIPTTAHFLQCFVNVVLPRLLVGKRSLHWCLRGCHGFRHDGVSARSQPTLEWKLLAEFIFCFPVRCLLSEWLLCVTFDLFVGGEVDLSPRCSIFLCFSFPSHVFRVRSRRSKGNGATRDQALGDGLMYWAIISLTVLLHMRVHTHAHCSQIACGQIWFYLCE